MVDSFVGFARHAVAGGVESLTPLDPDMPTTGAEIAGRQYGRVMGMQIAVAETVVGGFMAVQGTMNALAGGGLAAFGLAAAPAGGVTLPVSAGGALVFAEGVCEAVAGATTVGHGVISLMHQANLPSLPEASGGGASGKLSGRAGITETLSGLKAGRSSGVKVVGSEAELDALYGRLSAGGKPATPPTYKGSMVELPDGTRVGLRGVSASGGKTIDITLPDGTIRKVHVQQ
jgi:hypothetical protein